MALSQPNETRYYKVYSYTLTTDNQQYHEVLCYWNDGIRNRSQVVTRRGTKAEMEALIEELNLAIPNDNHIRRFLQKDV